MQSDLTDITVVMDRSGSMKSCQGDAEGGLNAFIDKQKAEPGRANFTLVQFDDKYEVVHNGIPIGTVPPLKLEPRGWTALYDAIGVTINTIGARLSALPESERPGLVVVVILTDGDENSSKEFTAEKVREMIARQMDVYKWQFTYLGANQDAFSVAGTIGIPQDAVGNYQKTSGAIGSASSNVARMRAASAGGQSVLNCYTDAERKAMASDDADTKK